jgi:hypothetical protein
LVEHLVGSSHQGATPLLAASSYRPNAPLSPPSISARPAAAPSPVPTPPPRQKGERSRKMAPPATLAVPPLTARLRRPPITSRHAASPHPRAPTLQRARAHRTGRFDRCRSTMPLARTPSGPQLQRARLRSAARHRHVPSPRRLPRVPRRRDTLPRRPRQRVPVRARTRLTRRAVLAHPERTRLASARIRTESTLAALAHASYAPDVHCVAASHGRTPAAAPHHGRVLDHPKPPVHAIWVRAHALHLPDTVSVK